ncbi:MAG: hypothetical protein JNL32_11390 [Candidatus Kapabacteria bacterium]|nr:hypothetical protein [Candidatus Kapabacteria bacterium]
MKTILIIAIILMAGIAASAQTVITPPALGTYSSDSVNTLSNSVLDTAMHNKFILGWNWSQGPTALNARYKMNADERHYQRIHRSLLMADERHGTQDNSNAYHHQQVDNRIHIQSSRSGSAIGAAF